MNYYHQYVSDIQEALAHLEVTGQDGAAVDSGEAMVQWCARTEAVREAGRAVYFVGNGASAMMASHMAADGSKNGGLRAMAFNDPAFLTAVGNDNGYELSFSVPLQRFGCRGDMLVTISSSGNSPNILAAIEAAGAIGITVITISGMGPDNACRSRGDLNFYVPAQTYGLVECCHQVLLHCWLDRYMEIREKRNDAGADSRTEARS